MRAVIQRVNNAEVSVKGEVIGRINKGFLVLLAINKNDEEEVVKKLADKILNLRIFEDRQGKMNLSIKNVNGEILVVSQFTLYGDVSKGNRPSFIESAEPNKARNYYERFVKYLEQTDLKISKGEFGALMEVKLTNYGPVTIIIDI